MKAVKILICEHEPVLHDRLKSGFTRILELTGRRADVRACDDIDTALELLNRDGFDILVSDLRFGRDIAVGLDFIREAKINYPELFVIACTTESPGAEALRNNTPSYDHFIPKRWITAAVPSEIEQLAAEVDSAFQRFTGFELRIVNAATKDLKVLGKPIGKRSLRALIAQAYSDLDGLDERFRPIAIELEPMTGGLSGSLVLQARLIADNPDIKFVSTVLKISAQSWAKQEFENFNRFAKWMLPFTKRTELVGYGETKDYGAVAYAFVMGGEEPHTTLTDHISRRSLQEVTAYINSIFDSEQVNFYQSTREVSQKSAAQHYRQRYFSDQQYDRNRQRFAEVVTRHLRGKLENGRFIVAKRSYPDPFTVLFTNETRSYTVSVCHGDLNANNVLCSKTRAVSYIDFQDTGAGHLFQDFAALEHSIRLNWAVEPNKVPAASSLMSRERQLSSNRIRSGGRSNYHHACHALRSHARGQFPDVDIWEYHYAACALALKLTRLPGMTPHQLGRLAACALVAAEALATGS